MAITRRTEDENRWKFDQNDRGSIPHSLASLKPGFFFKKVFNYFFALGRILGGRCNQDLVVVFLIRVFLVNNILYIQEALIYGMSHRRNKIEHWLNRHNQYVIHQDLSFYNCITSSGNHFNQHIRAMIIKYGIVA